MSESQSRARELMGYSFLVAFADDDLIEADELVFLERIALSDGKIDDAERAALQAIFARVDETRTAQKVLDEIRRFRAQYAI